MLMLFVAYHRLRATEATVGIVNTVGVCAHCHSGASRWRSRQSKHLSPLRSWVRFSLRTNVKIVSQRSAESHGFSPGAPVSLHTESGQGVLGTVYMDAS